MDRRDKKHEAYKGFEYTYNRALMAGKMMLFTSVGLVLSHLLLWGVVSAYKLPKDSLYYTAKWVESSIVSIIPMTAQQPLDLEVEGQVYSLPADQMYEYLRGIGSLTSISLMKYFVWTALIYIFGPLLIYRYKKHAAEIEESKHLRGEIGPIEPEKLRKLFEEDKLQTDIPLGETLGLPTSYETKHVFVVGSTGSGKTVCMSQALYRVRERGDKALVYDFQGDYLRWFYRPGDVIFNPLDKRSCNWNLFSEIRYKPDIEEYGKSVVPDLAGVKDPYFNRAACQVFVGILRTLINKGMGNNENLWRMLQLSREELRDNLEGDGTADAIHHLSQDRTGDNVLSTLKTYTKVFGYMIDSLNPLFSIKEWVEDEKDRRWVFLTSSQEYEETIKPVHTLFIDIASAKLNSLDTDIERRFFVFIDEFGTLHKLNSVKKLLIASRKKGGSIWIGVQSIGQIEAIYEHHDSDALIGSCNTSIVFPVQDNHSADYLAKKLGEREERQTNETITMGPELVRGGTTLQQHQRTEKAVLYSEISGLKERNAFVKFSGYPITKTYFEFKKFPIVAQALLLREDLKIKQPESAPEPEPVPDPQAPEDTKPDADDKPDSDVSLF